MVARLAQWTIDVVDVPMMARFWSEALGYTADLGDDGDGKLYPPADAPPGALTVWLQRVDEPKQADKNRNHMDLRPADGDVDAEVERLLSLGARPADVGQTGAERFVVLADPEGNEFCVLYREPREV